jgi:hypothetical protein
LTTLMNTNNQYPSVDDSHLAHQARADPEVFAELYPRQLTSIYRYRIVHSRVDNLSCYALPGEARRLKCGISPRLVNHEESINHIVLAIASKLWLKHFKRTDLVSPGNLSFTKRDPICPAPIIKLMHQGTIRAARKHCQSSTRHHCRRT